MLQGRVQFKHVFVFYRKAHFAHILINGEKTEQAGKAASLIPPLSSKKLLSKTKVSDELTISLDVLLLEVTKKATSLTNHLKKTSS